MLKDCPQVYSLIISATPAEVPVTAPSCHMVAPVTCGEYTTGDRPLYIASTGSSCSGGVLVAHATSDCGADLLQSLAEVERTRTRSAELFFMLDFSLVASARFGACQGPMIRL